MVLAKCQISGYKCVRSENSKLIFLPVDGDPCSIYNALSFGNWDQFYKMFLKIFSMLDTGVKMGSFWGLADTKPDIASWMVLQLNDISSR